MASAGHGSAHPSKAEDIRLVVDTMPGLVWSTRAAGSAEFFNQWWLEYTELSAEQALDWGWKAADIEKKNAVFPYFVEVRDTLKSVVALAGVSYHNQELKRRHHGNHKHGNTANEDGNRTNEGGANSKGGRRFRNR
jgi:hypothetical protein